MATSENQPGQRAAVEVTRRDPAQSWFGFDRFDGVAAPAAGTPEDQTAVTVQTVPAGHWSEDHVERLLATAPNGDRDTSGLVPVVAVQASEGGNVEVVSLRTDAPRFQERLDFRTPPSWNEGAGVALAAALAMEKGHSLGLRHGALLPKDVVVDGTELAIAGMGQSLGGTPEPGTSIAPEVATSGVPTVPGDVFSLGMLLRAATAGDPGTPEEIRALIDAATASDPADRPASALAFAERLREAGGDAIRSYSLMSFADSPLLAGSVAPPVAAAPAEPPAGVGAPAAAAAPATEPQPGAARRALPWVVGAGLVGLIGLGLWAAADGDNGAQPSTTTTTTVTTAATTTTTEPTTTTTTQPTTEPTTTEPTTTTTQPTTEPTTTEPTTTTTQPTPTSAVPPVPIGEAGVEVLHALPDTPVDAYLDGQLSIPGFGSGEIAGPVELEPGPHVLELFAAADEPPTEATDRADAPLGTSEFDVTGQPSTLVVAPDTTGRPTTYFFPEAVEPPIPAGEGRLTVRNPGPGPVAVAITPAVGGLPVAQTLDVGDAVTVDQPSGNVRVTITDPVGQTLVDTIVSIPEGTLTSATVAESSDGYQLYLQRIEGLGSPPDGIPTGDSGLLDRTSPARARGLLLAAVSSMLLLLLVGHQRLQHRNR